MKLKARILFTVSVLLVSNYSHAYNDNFMQYFAESVLPSTGELMYRSKKCNVYNNMDKDVMHAISKLSSDTHQEALLREIYNTARNEGNSALYEELDFADKALIRTSVATCSDSGKKFIRKLASFYGDLFLKIRKAPPP